MKRPPLTLGCALLTTLATNLFAGEPPASIQTANARLGRGINLDNALESPKEGAWGVTLQPEYFRLIRAAGFDTVRLPVRWSIHALAEPPYTLDPLFAARVDWADRPGDRQPPQHRRQRP